MKNNSNPEKQRLILNHSYLQPSFLDGFDLDKKVYELPSVTAIVPTYNRSPHTPQEDSNPLGWCLDSLISQKHSGLDEIVVIDDSSKDHTEDVVKSFQRNSPISIVYLRNDENKGSSISRNMAVEESKNEHIMFVDDDCVFSRYMIFGANYTMGILGEKAGALHLPVYHRKTFPVPISSDEIGRIDFDKGLITSNFGGFPEEYANNLEERFLDDELKVLSPIEIKNLAGVFMIKKQDFTEAGGFPGNLVWSNGYREETDLAIRLVEKGKSLFWTPDPKFHCVHLKYGAFDEFGTGGTPEQDSSLSRLISKSNVSLNETGNRVDPEEWFFNYIVSTYVVIGKKSPSAAQEYLDELRVSFVEENKTRVSGVNSKIEDKIRRREIFERAIAEGERFIRSA